MSAPVKEFVMKLVAEDPESFESNEDRVLEEDHFNIRWKLTLSRSDQSFHLYLDGSTENIDKWRLKSVTVLRVFSENGKSLTYEKAHYYGNTIFDSGEFSWYNIFPWNEFVNEYVADNRVTFEAHVTIEKMIGFDKEELRKFDESISKYSDVVIVVKDRKFYLSKLFLALQSSYFDSLLLRNFDESNKSEIVLNDIDPNDFQNFLELIHGEDSIDNNTFDGILHLADMYDVPTAIKRCETFLLVKSCE